GAAEYFRFAVPVGGPSRCRIRPVADELPYLDVELLGIDRLERYHLRLQERMPSQDSYADGTMSLGEPGSILHERHVSCLDDVLLHDGIEEQRQVEYDVRI